MKKLNLHITDNQAEFLRWLSDSERLSVSHIVQCAIALLEKELPKI